MSSETSSKTATKTVRECRKVRFPRLKEVYKVAVERTAESLITDEVLGDAFPLIANMENGPDLLQKARLQMEELFLNGSMKSFERVSERLEVEQRLNDLDEIIYDAQKRFDTQTGYRLRYDDIDAELLMNAAAYKSKFGAIENLQQIYDRICQENASLHDELKSHTQECSNIKSNILSLVDTLVNGIDEGKKRKFEQLLEKLAEEIFKD